MVNVRLREKNDSQDRMILNLEEDSYSAEDAYKEVSDIIKNDKNSGNTYVFMGAGSVSKIAHEIANDLKKM